MRLHCTPRSHFSRKVRLLLDAWGLPYEQVDAGNVAGTSPEKMGANPLMKVPALELEGETLFESDHIAQHLTRRFDPRDAFGVLTTNVAVLNARAVMNGMMASEVEVILARRTGIDTSAFPRFDKHLLAIRQGFSWLESRAELFPEAPSYAGFHLTALWDHVALYALIDMPYPGLRARVEALASLPYVAKSKPV